MTVAGEKIQQHQHRHSLNTTSSFGTLRYVALISLLLYQLQREIMAKKPPGITSVARAQRHVYPQGFLAQFPQSQASQAYTFYFLRES